MNHTQRGNLRELEEVLHYAAIELSEAQAATLVAHPNAVRSALAVTAHALSRKPGSEHSVKADVETIAGTDPSRVEAKEAKRQLSRRTRVGEEKELLTSGELAERVGLKTRQSVHDWLRKGKIIGWLGAKRGYAFPADQLDDRGRPPEGLDQIVSRFEDGYAAWVWLTTPRPSLDGTKPLALLQKGESDRVVAAAEGDMQGDFA